MEYFRDGNMPSSNAAMPENYYRRDNSLDMCDYANISNNGNAFGRNDCDFNTYNTNTHNRPPCFQDLVQDLSYATSGLGFGRPTEFPSMSPWRFPPLSYSDYGPYENTTSSNVYRQPPRTPAVQDVVQDLSCSSTLTNVALAKPIDIVEKEDPKQTVSADVIVDHPSGKKKPKKYKCDQCPMMFKKFAALYMHKREHKLTSSFVCKVYYRPVKEKELVKRPVKKSIEGRGGPACKFEGRNRKSKHTSKHESTNASVSSKINALEKSSTVRSKTDTNNEEYTRTCSVRSVPAQKSPVNKRSSKSRRDSNVKREPFLPGPVQALTVSLTDMQKKYQNESGGSDNKVKEENSIEIAAPDEDDSTLKDEDVESEETVQKMEGDDNDLNYYCFLCRHQFPDVAELNIHLRCHSSVTTYSCETCSSVFLAKSDLSEHMNEHREPNSQSDDEEIKVLSQSDNEPRTTISQSDDEERTISQSDDEDSKSHSLSDDEYEKTQSESDKDHEKKQSECDSKRRRTRSADNSEHKNSKKKFPCKICKKRFARPNDRRLHAIRHLDHMENEISKVKPGKPYTCFVCDASFGEADDLRVHLKGDHLNGKVYSCTVCKKEMIYRTEYQQHMKTHSSKSFTCKDCDRHYKALKDLRRHIKRVHTKEVDEGFEESKPFPCKLCKRRYMHANELLTHENKHLARIEDQIKNTDPAESFECSFCEETFEEDDDFRIHIKKDHMKSKIFTCLACNKEFVYRSDFKDHLETHDSGDFKCNDCDKGFKGQEQLLQHIKRMHGEPKVKVDENAQCSVCDKTFTKITYLKKHMEIHYKREKFPCTICGKTYTSKTNLHIHEITHTKEKTFKCDICGAKFFYACILKRHMTAHSEAREFECKKCKKCFKSDVTLRSHLKTHEENDVRYHCHICSHSFKTRSGLAGHIERHDDTRPFKCDECGKAFKVSRDLHCHKAIHTDVKKFKCDECGNRFRNAHCLTVHMRVHSGDRPFKCQFCGKGHICKGSMVRHERVHTGEKPYVCDTCGKAFRTNTYLKRHILVHTGEKPYECDICKKRFNKQCNLNVHKQIHKEIKDFVCDLCGKQFVQRRFLRKHMETHGVLNSPANNETTAASNYQQSTTISAEWMNGYPPC